MELAGHGRQEASDHGGARRGAQSRQCASVVGAYPCSVSTTRHVPYGSLGRVHRGAPRGAAPRHPAARPASQSPRAVQPSPITLDAFLLDCISGHCRYATAIPGHTEVVYDAGSKPLCALIHGIDGFAQFIAICSSVKRCEIGENLLSVSDPRSGSQERLIDVDALIPSPALQYRPVSSLHPYAAVERSVAPVSPVPESGHRSVGDVPLSPRL